MRIIIDAMGGDNAPEEIVHGAADAAKEYDVDITLVGDEEKIRPLAEKYEFPRERLEIIHTPTVLTMEDDPMDVVRKKKDCSMISERSAYRIPCLISLADLMMMNLP